MSNETILRDALREALEFITTLFNHGDSIELGEAGSKRIEDSLRKALAQATSDSKTQAYLAKGDNWCPFCGVML